MQRQKEDAHEDADTEASTRQRDEENARGSCSLRPLLRQHWLCLGNHGSQADNTHRSQQSLPLRTNRGKRRARITLSKGGSETERRRASQQQQQQQQQQSACLSSV